MAHQVDELRIALVMRGGVSLAVWMGGACQEVARLREGAGRYGPLRDFAGYDRVVVDVLVGTSAGGLNGVLLSRHVACGAPFDHRVRDLWLRFGDLDGLTRRPWGDPPSLLLGDKGFYARLRAAMSGPLAADPSASAADHPLRLLVTGTRLRARPDALLPVVGTALPAGRSRAFFRFRYPGSTHAAALNDFAGTAAVERLAYAARATSSFPGAFEAATPHVGAGTPANGRVDLRGVSSETGVPDPGLDGAVELIDGGVLNNIPISWALRTIAGLPAERPVDRWLVYLQPVPASPADPDSAGKARSITRVVKLLRSVSAVRNGSESVLDDAGELYTAMAGARALRSSLAPVRSLVANGGLVTTATATVAEYGVHAGSAEAARLRVLLTDPHSVLGPDPLPIPDTAFPLASLATGGALDDDVKPLRVLLDDTAAELVHPAGTGIAGIGCSTRTPFVAARTVTLLLHLVRDAEAEGLAVGGPLRERLYALRTVVETVVAARDRLLLRATRLEADRTADALLRHSAGLLKQVLLDAPLPDADTDTEIWRDYAGILAEATAEALRQPQALAEPSDWPVDLYAPLWCALVAVAEGLGDQWDRKNWLLPGSGLDKTGERLAAVEVLTGALRPDPLSAPTPTRLAVVAASNVSPLEAEIFGAKLPDASRTDRKLSGNQVSNFAAFLSARWRLNDWVWGRLDGAVTLVDLVARQGRLADLPAKDLRELFVGGATSDWENFFVRRWNDAYADRAKKESAKVARDAMVERIQWDILAEELPLLRELSERRAHQDCPPDADAVPPPQADGPLQPVDLELLGDIGAESVVGLLRRWDLRRTLLRLGLVAWRSVLPSGAAGIVVRWPLGATVAPLLYLPLLLVLVAPIASMGAAVAASFAVAATTGRWGSPAQLPTALSFVLAAASYAWQRWAPAVARRELEQSDRPGFWTRWGVPLAAAGGGLAATALVLCATWNAPQTVLPQWSAGAFAAGAVMLPFLFGASTGGGGGGVWPWVRGLAVVDLACLTAGAVTITARCLGDSWASGPAVVYVSLLLTLGGLYALLSLGGDQDVST